MNLIARGAFLALMGPSSSGKRTLHENVMFPAYAFHGRETAAARQRYDGRVRNPFNEYECGHWYARAMSSYGLLQGLTGVRYDAVEQTLYIDSKIGSDFESFLSTVTGFATVGLKQGTPFIEVKYGDIHIAACIVSGRKMKLER